MSELSPPTFDGHRRRGRNPEELTPLRPLLSYKKLFLVPDDVESILNPRGDSAQEIYDMVEELNQLELFVPALHPGSP